MKKTSIFMSLLTLVLGFASCSQDREPVLQKPTEFHLNTPIFADNLLILEKEGEGSEFNLTVSQPNYGMGTPTHYEVQVSLTEDFNDFRALSTVDTQAKIVVNAFEYCVGINELLGVEEEDQFAAVAGPRDVYTRVRAYIPGAEYSSINSNVVKLNVLPFFAVMQPAKIYVIGDFQGWNINSADVYVDESENGINSNIFSNVFDIPAGKATFRFYSALGDWEHNSIGYQVDDNATSFTFNADGMVETPCVAGKGSWTFPDWEGGRMKVTLNMNQMKAYFQKVD